MNPILGINTFGCNTTDQNHRIKNCRTNTMSQPWKCVNFSLHERNFSLHESTWTFLYMKETFLYMKVRELFSTWKKLFSAWKCVNLKITLLHYNLSSEWFSIKDKTCLIIPTKLAFPPTAKIHPIFHVSCLKKVIRNNCRIQTSLPKLDEEGSIWLQPEQVLDTGDRHLRGRMIREVLVKWKDTSPEDATWEPTTILQQFL